MTPHKTLGETIRLARENGLGTHRAAFAHELDVSERTVYYWEHDKRVPSLLAFIRMLDVVPVSWALVLLKVAGMKDPTQFVIAAHDHAIQSLNTILMDLTID